MGLYNLVQGPITGPVQSEISFSQLLAEVDNGNVTDVEISGDSISGHFADGRGFNTFAPSDPTLIQRLYDKGVVINAKPSKEGGPTLLGVLISWFPSVFNSRLDFLYETNARWWWQSYGFCNLCAKTFK